MRQQIISLINKGQDILKLIKEIENGVSHDDKLVFYKEFKIEYRSWNRSFDDINNNEARELLRCQFEGDKLLKDGGIKRYLSEADSIVNTQNVFDNESFTLLILKIDIGVTEQIAVFQRILKQVINNQYIPTERLIQPVSLFGGKNYSIDAKLCFVIMPFDKDFQDIYDYAIEKVVTEIGMTCVRGDSIFSPGPIMAQIWEQLMKARIVIADITGTNGNVMYELGLAHVIGHETILLTQKEEDVPFDLRHLRYIPYNTTPSGIDTLKKKIKKSLEELLKTNTNTFFR